MSVCDNILEDVNWCDFCEIIYIEYYCDFCYINLCKLCIGEYILNGYDKYKIVLFKYWWFILIYLMC